MGTSYVIKVAHKALESLLSDDDRKMNSLYEEKKSGFLLETMLKVDSN